MNFNPTKKVKRTTAADALANVRILLDRHMSFKLLQEMDAREAMNMVIASGNDPRFTFIVAHMNNNDIWRYWMYRDLQIVMDQYNNQLPTNWPVDPSTMALPWKYVYLWSRLVVASMQYSRISLIDRTNISLPVPNIAFKQLNTITMQSNPNTPIVEFDFEDNWSLIYSLSRKAHHPQRVPVYSIMGLRQQYVGLSAYYFITQVLYNEKLDNILGSVISVLYDVISFPTQNIQYNSHQNPVEITALLQDYPRFVERTKLIVACKICDKTTDLKHCGGCMKQVYCSTKCQAKDYKEHRQECQ